MTSKVSNEWMIDEHTEVQNWEVVLICFRQQQETWACWKGNTFGKGVSVLQHQISVFLKTNFSFKYWKNQPTNKKHTSSLQKEEGEKKNQS